MPKYRENALALLVALVATGGSLYLSEVLGFIPCKLCWIQRIFMYPLVIFIGIAHLRGERKVYEYVLPFSVLGGLTSLYHYLMQKLPAFHKTGAACGPIPCTDSYINLLGFITIPFMALVAFTLITVLMIKLQRLERAQQQETTFRGFTQ